LRIKIISRGKGKSAVTEAAYRAGEKIRNEYDRMEHDYIRKGGVIHTDIILPDNAPAEYSDTKLYKRRKQTVKRAANNESDMNTRKGEHIAFCCWGGSKGYSLWHTTFAESLVCYACPAD